MLMFMLSAKINKINLMKAPQNHSVVFTQSKKTNKTTKTIEMAYL